MNRRRSLDPLDLLLGLSTVGLAALVDPAPGIRGVLVLIAALVLLWPATGSPRKGADRTTSRRAARASERRRTRLIACLALASATFAVHGHLTAFMTTWKVRVWNVYHYYVGAKYFPELGYTDLYDARLNADHEGDRYWRRISRVRNLRNYQIEDRRFRIRDYQWSDNFQPQRWQSFGRDVAALSGQRSAGDWQAIFQDRGYNGTPLWTVVGGGLANLVPADRQLGLKLLCSLDLLLLAATLGLIWRTFGLRPAALVLLLLTATPINLGRFVGGYLQYDWFCAFAAGVCYYRRRRPVLAAGAMAYAALTRIFPLLFVAAGAIPALTRWRRTGRRPLRQLRFLAVFALWCALGFIVSLANGRGLGGWGEFATNLSVHREHHLFGKARVGLKRVFIHDLGKLDRLRSDGNPSARLREVVPSARLRREVVPLARLRRDPRHAYDKQRSLYMVSAGALLIFFLLVVRRQRTWDAQLLGLVPVFALLVTSRYYWSYLALLPLMGGRRGPPGKRSRWLSAGQLLVLAGYYAVDSRGIGPYAAYGILNVLLAGFFVFMLAMYLWSSRRPSRAALDSM